MTAIEDQPYRVYARGELPPLFTRFWKEVVVPDYLSLHGSFESGIGFHFLADLWPNIDSHNVRRRRYYALECIGLELNFDPTWHILATLQYRWVSTRFQDTTTLLELVRHIYNLACTLPNPFTRPLVIRVRAGPKSYGSRTVTATPPGVIETLVHQDRWTIQEHNPVKLEKQCPVRENSGLRFLDTRMIPDLVNLVAECLRGVEEQGQTRAFMRQQKYKRSR